jgi:phage shock protein C
MRPFGGNPPPRNPIRLYRDTENGWVAGVCAGLADYVGIDRKLVRLAFVLGLFFFFPPVIITYLVLAFLLKPRPGPMFQSVDEERFWRTVTTQPNRTVAELRQRFRHLDQRLSEIERRATSDEFDLRQKFRDLGSG